MADSADEGRWTVHDDYAVQYFGFQPQSLFNGMYNCTWEYTREAVDALKENILSRNVSETEFQEVSNRRMKDAMNRLDDKFDKAELYLLSNVFNIPKHIVLPEDKIQMENPCTAEEMKELDNEIQLVMDKIIAVKYANTVLQSRWKKIGELKTQIDSSAAGLDQICSDVSKQCQETIRSANNLQQSKELLKNCG